MGMLNKVKIKDDKGNYTGIEDYGPSLTVQSLRDDTDINKIVKRMEKGQMLDNLREDGRFEDVSEFDGLADAYIKVQNANELFMGIPADIRSRFNNDPAELIEFLADEGNRKEAESMGLVNPKPIEAGSPATIPPVEPAPAQ